MILQAKPLVSDELVVAVAGNAPVLGECAVCYDANKTLVAASFSCAHTPICCKDCMSQFLDTAVEENPYRKTIKCFLEEGCEVITTI
jgi:hypothetical protein